jgi:hypothetical protein
MDGMRIVQGVGRRMDEGLNYECVHVRRWFQNQIGARDRGVANDVERGNGEASGAWLLCSEYQQWLSHSPRSSQVVAGKFFIS